MTTEKESETLSLRLSKADKAMLDELVEAKRQELAPLGATTSLAQYVRGWIRSTHAAMVAKRNQRSTYESAPTLPATVPLPATALAGPAVSAAPAPTEAQVRPLPATALAGPAVSAAPAPTEAQVRPLPATALAGPAVSAAPAPTEAQVRPLPATALAGPAVSAAPAPTEADVRRKLKASKRSQAELSRATGIAASMLSRFANGKKPLSPEKLARLAVELDR